MTIQEILKTKPEACKILLNFGLGCAGCELGAIETLEEGAKAHGLSDKEIQDLVDLINSETNETTMRRHDTF